MRISDWSSDVCSSDLAGFQVRSYPRYDSIRGDLRCLQWACRSLSCSDDLSVSGRLVSSFSLLFPASESEPNDLCSDRCPCISGRATHAPDVAARSEERRVGKEGVCTLRSRWSP